jgi:hypothetical protein
LCTDSSWFINRPSKIAYERLKIVTRQTIAAQPASALLGSVESTVRLTLKVLSAPPGDALALEELEGEQARIRRTARHWLLG